jgi:predicted metal-dependent enzyme (double-stranded beta helix superfamily)
MSKQSIESFVEACTTARLGGDGQHAATDLMREVFGDRQARARLFGEPDRSGIFPLHRSEHLTFLNVVWKPGMNVGPHNHQTWAVIGMYCGRENNIFWRRLRDENATRIEAAGAKSFGVGEVMPLGHDIIHSVQNPIDRFSAAIHIYGGDFFALARSEWDAEHLTERPYDMAANQARFFDLAERSST